MEVTLLRGAAAAKAKKNFRLDPNDVQQMAVHIAHVARENFGAAINKLRFVYQDSEPASAYIKPKNGEVVINFSQIRTLRDIVFSIGHEAAHAKQIEAFGSPYNMVSAYQMEVFLWGYHNAPMEQEADSFGFHFEDSFSYKNQVIKTDTESIFIHRKSNPRGV